MNQLTLTETTPESNPFDPKFKSTRPLTPEVAARCLRRTFEQNIAKTWAEYFSDMHQVDKYMFFKMIQEQSGCDFETACDAALVVVPEFFSDYWEARRDTNGKQVAR